MQLGWSASQAIAIDIDTIIYMTTMNFGLITELNDLIEYHFLTFEDENPFGFVDRVASERIDWVLNQIR